MNSILLVEDNYSISDALTFSLEKAGFSAKVADCIAKAEDFLDKETFSLVLLDVTLPDGNGFDLYKNSIKDRCIPVIFLTARDEENDIVRGLEMGAEDYITKPFSTKELMARVKRTMLRYKQNTKLKSGNIEFDMDKMEVTRGGEILAFSKLEMTILHLLFSNHDKAVRRDDVIDCIYEATGNDVYDHTVTVYLKRIREKLQDDIIKTIKGVGYRIDLD